MRRAWVKLEPTLGKQQDNGYLGAPIARVWRNYEDVVCVRLLQQGLGLMKDATTDDTVLTLALLPDRHCWLICQKGVVPARGEPIASRSEPDFQSVVETAMAGRECIVAASRKVKPSRRRHGRWPYRERKETVVGGRWARAGWRQQRRWILQSCPVFLCTGLKAREYR